MIENYDSNSLCGLSQNDVGKVYLTTGMTLKKCISQKEDALIYIWGPKCKSPVCVPLNVLQRFCDENKMELYVVAEYYDGELMKIEYNIERPVFGINTNYYKTNLTYKYLPRFIQDITSSTIPLENRFLYFHYGNYINSFPSIEKVEQRNLERE